MIVLQIIILMLPGIFIGFLIGYANGSKEKEQLEEVLYQNGLMQFANRPIVGRKVMPPPKPDFSIKPNKKETVYE